MYFKAWIAFILIVSWVVDRFFSLPEETGKQPLKFLKKNPLLLTALLVFGLVYLFDLMGGRFVWLAFLLGLAFMFTMIKLSAKGLLRKILHLLGFGFIMLCFINVLLYTRYELQHQFHQPCWSPDGKQIAFFMQKNLIQYRFGLLGGWSPNPMWSKCYLCTMDYDGGNFKVVKKFEGSGYSGYTSWSGTGEILFQKNESETKKAIYKINPQNGEQEKLFELDSKMRVWLWPAWLSPKGNYLVANYTILENTHMLEHGIVIIDPRQEKELKKITYDTKLNVSGIYGSYKRNEIAYTIEKVDSKIETQTLFKYNIDTGKIDKQEIPALGNPMEYFEGFTYSSASYVYSPDRSMYAQEGIVRTSTGNKVISDFYVKPKCSYLFNIFGE